MPLLFVTNGQGWQQEIKSTTLISFWQHDYIEVTVYFVGPRTRMPLSCHRWAILHRPLPVHCLWYRRRVGWLGRRLLLRSLSEYQLSAEESECSGDLVQLRVHLLCLEQHYIWVSIALYPVLLIPNKVICSLLDWTIQWQKFSNFKSEPLMLRWCHS